MLPMMLMKKERIDKMKSEDYIVVTTISSHQVRYVMHRTDLWELYLKKAPQKIANVVELAEAVVTAEECEDFSQEHKGECIINTVEMDENDVLALFDKENAYLSGWTKDQKIEWIRKTIDK
jgi:hypothetical protein